MIGVTKLAVFAATALLIMVGSAFATDEGLPVEVVIDAIQTAVADNPGLVTDVEVEREGGILIVEVKIIDEKGMKTEVKVDPEKK